MQHDNGQPYRIRFGVFEVDLQAGEVRRQGLKVKLQAQPIQVLAILLGQPGQVVSREALQKQLWPADTFVDSERGLNRAINKLRDALADNADNPRFIETLPRHGYRFIASVESVDPVRVPVPVPPADRVSAEQSDKSKRSIGVAVLQCGVGLLLATAVWAWMHFQSPEKAPAQLRPTPLTATLGWESAPSFSPDGNEVAYSWSASGNILAKDRHIYVTTVGSGKPLQLTSHASSDRTPSWSPDGREIAFLRSLGSTTGLYVIPLLGGLERKVAEGDFGRLSWSPDGKFLATSEAAPALPEHSSLWLVDVENGNKLALTTQSVDKPEDRNPSFSPDGKRILFVRCDGGNRCGLYLQDLTGDFRPSGAAQLVRWEDTFIADAAWMQDGGDIVYSSSEDNGATYQLMKVRVGRGSQPKPIVTPDQTPTELAIARRGNRMAYAQYSLNRHIWQIRPGGLPESFVSSTRTEKDPQFSPDGKHVAFSSDRSGLMQIWLCDRDGTNAGQLTRFDSGFSGTPRWSPDGRTLAFDHQSKQGWRIYLMAFDGGQSHLLTLDGGKRNEVIPSWSRDGKYIYYSSDGGGSPANYGLWKSLVQFGNRVQLTNDHGTVSFESPDAQSLYYLRGFDATSDLWRLSLRSGEAELALKGVVKRGFVVAENGLYYLTAASADGSASLRFQNFTTGKQREIARLKEVDGNGLSVAPDGKTILYSAAVRSGSNVMIVDHFQ